MGALSLLTEGTRVCKQVTEGKIDVGLKLTGRRGRRRKQLLYDSAVGGDLAFEVALGLSYDGQQNKCVRVCVYINACTRAHTHTHTHTHRGGPCIFAVYGSPKKKI